MCYLKTSIGLLVLLTCSSGCVELAGQDRSYAMHPGLDLSTRRFDEIKPLLSPLTDDVGGSAGCKTCAH